MERKTALNSMLAGLMALVFAVGEALAVPAATPQTQSIVRTVAADCYAVGEQVAAQQGGQLARATASTQNGQQVCVIVVLVPARDGQRPRRAEFTVPAN